MFLGFTSIFLFLFYMHPCFSCPAIVNIYFYSFFLILCGGAFLST